MVFLTLALFSGEFSFIIVLYPHIFQKSPSPFFHLQLTSLFLKTRVKCSFSCICQKFKSAQTNKNPWKLQFYNVTTPARRNFYGFFPTNFDHLRNIGLNVANIDNNVNVRIYDSLYNLSYQKHVVTIFKSFNY